MWPNVARPTSTRTTAHIRSNNKGVEQRSVNPGNIVSRVPMSLSTQRKEKRRKEGSFYRMKKQIYLCSVSSETPVHSSHNQPGKSGAICITSTSLLLHIHNQESETRKKKKDSTTYPCAGDPRPLGLCTLLKLPLVLLEPNPFL